MKTPVKFDARQAAREVLRGPCKRTNYPISTLEAVEEILKKIVLKAFRDSNIEGPYIKDYSEGRYERSPGLTGNQHRNM